MAATTLCLGLTAAQSPSSAPDPATPTTRETFTVSAVGLPPSIRPVTDAGPVGSFGSTVAGLVDVDSRIPGGISSGTGIVLRSDGVAVTNNHVVARSTGIEATDLGDGHTYSAVVLERDPGHDVAVIQLVGAAHLSVAPIGDSDGLSVGDRVAAIGNAGGRGGRPTISTGEVTALGQSIVATDEYANQRRHLHGMIEVSASVQPGDSGGALAGSGGIVGMVTATSPGAGYAIPINTVMGIADRVSLKRLTSTRAE